MGRIRKTHLLVCLMSTLTLLVPRLVSAQDTHYWTNQYGPRSMLLGGAVIGSVGDMSATYYNPGALGYVKKPALLLSANAYQISTLKVESGAGEGIDLNTSDFSALPNMLAGGVRASWLGKNRFAYSLLTRHRARAELKNSRVTKADVLPESPGEEDFAGGLLADGATKELWAGITWARGLSERVGIGVTQYLSIYNRSKQFDVFAQALTEDGHVALVYDANNYSSDVYSLLWKAGLGFDFTPVTVGVTITTPNIRLFGSGASTFNSTRVGLDLDGDGTPDDTFETDVQTEVKTHHKSPLSVGVGAAWHFSSTTIHGSMEWFDGVDSYDVLELESYVSQGTGEVVTPTLRQKLDSVVNFAVGLEHVFNERATGYVSFNTDRSAFNSESDVSLTEFDIYHTTGGSNLTFGRYELMLGASYAWGSQTTQQAIDLNPEDDEEVINPEDTVDVIYRSLTFLIGFSVKL